MSPPSHHRPGGGFRNPWPSGRQHGFLGVLKWALVERTRRRIAGTMPDDARVTFPVVPSAFATPRAGAGRTSLTWVGHSTFLIQAAGRNILTDPVWGARASPVAFAGPRRRVPAAVAFEALPPIDVVLISHDHYDHLDEPTVRRLAAEHPGARWAAPLGVRAWLERRGVRVVTEHDWWDAVALEPDADAGAGARDGGAAPRLTATCVPAQHFSGRAVAGRDATLWCGWVLSWDDGVAEGGRRRAIYYVGDTGLHPAFAEIGARAGPFDLVLMPIGAYDPRWFMRPVHLDPEEAIEAYRAMTGAKTLGSGSPGPALVGMHWGTFKLTDEALDEPPRRTRAAWERAGLDSSSLWILAHGETRELNDSP